MVQEIIYGLMITGKSKAHHYFATRAVNSFLGQTYPNRQLIVINDGPYRLSETFGDRITEVYINDKLSLGDLRNASLEQVPDGALWVQWDDDDWRHPESVERQYQHLRKIGADACYLKRQVQYCFSLNSAWIKEGYLWGTIMARKNSLRYEALSKEEDTKFLKEYEKNYRVTEYDNPSHDYLRFIHGHNTWDAAHFRLHQRSENDWQIPPEAQDYLKKILNHYSLFF